MQRYFLGSSFSEGSIGGGFSLSTLLGGREVIILYCSTVSVWFLCIFCAISVSVRGPVGGFSICWLDWKRVFFICLVGGF